MRLTGTRPGRAAAWLAIVLAAAASLLCLLAGQKGCRLATLLGSEGLYFLIGVLIYAFLDGRLGGTGVLSAALAASTTVFLKQLLQLPRPPGAPLVGAVGPGFPSGHTTVATGFWLGMGLYSGDPLLLAAGAWLGAVVGYTRVAIGAHYPADVVGGFVVGLAAAYVASVLARREAVAWASWVAAAAAALLVFEAGLLAPSYRAAWRLLGIDLGLSAVGAWVWLRGLEVCLAKGLGLAGRIAAAVLPLAILGAAVVGEHVAGAPGSLAGFALFSAAALGARPLLCLVGGGTRGGG